LLGIAHWRKISSVIDPQSLPWGANSANFPENPKKTLKNRRKPVEIRYFPLTNFKKSRKVNGVRISETRVNPAYPRI
jgi:hypothetical protein